jgi:hypothetical protein
MGGRRVLRLAVALLAPASLHGAPAPEAPAPSIELRPESVRMGAFYAGTTVQVEGSTPPGTEVLVVIRGAEESELFNRKARVGPVWVNVDRVHVTRVPSLFLRLGGGDLRSLLDPASIEAYLLDDSALKGRMGCRVHCKCRVGGPAPASGSDGQCPTGVEPDEAFADLIRNSYMSLKAEEGTFQVHPDAVRVVESGSGATRYAAEVDWPRKARPGSYEVEVLACRDRTVVGRASAVLQVVEVGFPARVGAMAERHSSTYGLAAILAAVLAGFAMDALVHRRRRPSGRGRDPRPPPPAGREPEPVARTSSEEQAEPVGSAGGSRRR